MQRVGAKKGLGQHFLTDKNIARKIVDSMLSQPFASLVEIGPGTGVLTQYILQAEPEEFIAVDLDKESIDYLTVHFPEHANQFVFADFLKYPLEQHGAPMALVGNLPYYISSQIS